MFTRTGRFKRYSFDVKLNIDGEPDWWDWKDICKYAPNTQAQFNAYKIQFVEVTGDLSQIIDLFVRINSTGKSLTSSEKRHARFYKSPFLKEAEKLVKKFQTYLLNQKILTKLQLSRMKGTELFAELLMSIHKGGPINKKTSLDRAISNDSINTNTLRRLSREFITTMNRIKRMFPNLRQTRFRNTVEFYSLFLLIWEMEKDKLILTNKKANQLAFTILVKLSTEVDRLRESYRRAQSTKPKPPYSDYLLTIQGDTDSSAARERRAKILRNLLLPIFNRKDNQRTFSQEQRRIIWNTDKTQKCSKCGKLLTWDDFTIDHIIAYAKGGKTHLPNAQLMCRKCNLRKGCR